MNPNIFSQMLHPNYNRFMPNSINCFLISSMEQFLQAQPNTDGSTTMFADFDNGKIYTNRLDLNTGKNDMREYTFSQTFYNVEQKNTEPVLNEENFVSKQDLSTFKEDILQKISEMVGGMSNVQQPIQSMATTADANAATDATTNATADATTTKSTGKRSKSFVTSSDTPISE